MENEKKQQLKEVILSNGFKSWCTKNTAEVFENLFEAKVEQSEKNEGVSHQEVSAVIAFMNQDIEAVLQLSCSKSVIVGLVKKAYQDNFNDVQSVFFLGEAVNIIFGMLKEELNLFGLYYDKCLPVVISGQDHLILNLNDADLHVQNFKTEFGVVSLKIGLNDKKFLLKAVS